jgi:preprotein translocase subunit SecF
MKTYPFAIIKNSFLWLTIGLIAVIISLRSFFTHFRLSIQFTGGMELKVINLQNIENVKTTITTLLEQKQIGNPEVTVSTKELILNNTATKITSLLITLPNNDEAALGELSQFLGEGLIKSQHIKSNNEILETSVIGPSVGDYMKSSALWALVVGLIIMAGYMMFSFATIRDAISPAILAIITIVTMFFDIIIPAGGYGFLMMLDPTAQVDTIFVIVLLTIMGYSINDTIIIFDRVRENILNNTKKLQQKQISIADIFEMSLRQTMSRSL